MSKSFISEPVQLSLDEIYNAILAKERDYATQLYAQFKGITLARAEQAMSVIYRVFHLGYEDCLHNVSIDDMPGFENKMYVDVWQAGFAYALKLSTFKVKNKKFSTSSTALICNERRGEIRQVNLAP
ncbi:hypothetical protein [uncultured Paraglaciecola sp.]|uniref:hypothetical protein n=1 Tax=uncultured Paraglaciecola sp. TaxID=1765024 RepID=UPI0030D78DD2|tara:strand:- start:23342 stop:23722 length:381 start_codon:yes stop_codon:yes gene_type:complete